MKISAGFISGMFLLLMAAPLWGGEGSSPDRQTSPYLSLGSSVVFPFSVDTTSPVLSPAQTRTQTGWDINGGIGYRFGDFRVAAEILYGRNDADHISFSGGGGDVSGHYEIWSATANLFYDIPTGMKLRPYVGAGLGGAHFAAKDITLFGFPPAHGDNTLFTYRLMAGLSYALTDSRRVFIGYRFTDMGKQDYETGGVPLRGDAIRSHAVQVGLQFYF